MEDVITEKVKESFKMLVFVYGTLMSNKGNNGYLHGCKLVGKAETVEKYELTANGIPFVNPNIKTHTVKGEVWELNTPEELRRVDGLEGYNPNDHEGSWYKRTPIQVTLETGEQIEANIYFNDRIGKQVVENGDYNNYKR